MLLDYLIGLRCRSISSAVLNSEMLYRTAMNGIKRNGPVIVEAFGRLKYKSIVLLSFVASIPERF